MPNGCGTEIQRVGAGLGRARLGLRVMVCAWEHKPAFSLRSSRRRCAQVNWVECSLRRSCVESFTTLEASSLPELNAVVSGLYALLPRPVLSDCSRFKFFFFFFFFFFI